MTSTISGSSFDPISPNPYIVGNPIRDPAMFFGREAEFDLIRKRFKDSPDEGGLLVFCGERRSGKTSILFQILVGRLGEDFIPVLVDMQSMAIEDETGFLRRITDEIFARLGSAATKLTAPDFDGGGRPSAVFQRFVEAVISYYPKKKLILLIDEYELLETKIDTGVLTEDVLLILASLMEKQSVYIVFTGSVNINERKREYWHRFLAKSGYRQISFLHRSDAMRLITEPVKGRVRYEDGVVESIYRSSAGQAFYTQGICQGFVDYMNDHETNHATMEGLEEVIKGIIDNPFPQMRFRWDGLTKDEKLVLSLLAETLEDGDAYASAKAVHRLISKKKYPLDLSFPRIAAVLESLFESEVLLKSHDAPPGFAFRMDLWRRWVLRTHSVWAVMRELGLKLRSPFRIPTPLLLMGAVVVIAGLSVTLKNCWPGDDQTPTAAELVHVELKAAQNTASIYVDEEFRDTGSLSELIEAGDHKFKITCEGYRDSVFSAVLVSEETFRRVIELRPLLGNVLIKTKPEGAELWINEEPQGRSPKIVPGLEVPKTHELEARLDPYHPFRTEFSVQADTVTTILASLQIKTTEFDVRTTPSGAQIFLGTDNVGLSPHTVTAIEVGTVLTVRAEMDDYLPTERRVTVTEDMAPVRLALEPEPPGYLLIKGDDAAWMLIDDEVVVTGEWNSGLRERKKGSYQIEIRLESGEIITKSVEVRSGYKVTFDYTRDEVVSEAWTGESQ